MSGIKSNLMINYIELKYRLLYLWYSAIFSFVICFLYRVQIFFLISNLFLQYAEGFIYTGLLDPLIIYIKLSVVSSYVIVFPGFVYLIGFFFFKSLYSFQTRYFFIYIITLYFSSVFLFIVICKTVLPVVVNFLINFQRVDVHSLLEVKLQATITQYYDFFFLYLLIYAAVILTPNVFLILVLAGLISREVFLEHRYRKTMYLIVCFTFACTTPPDLSFHFVTIPFLLLVLEVYVYFITFFYKLYDSYA